LIPAGILLSIIVITLIAELGWQESTGLVV